MSFLRNFFKCAVSTKYQGFRWYNKKDTNSRAIRTLSLRVFEVVHRVVVDAILLGLIMQMRAGRIPCCADFADFFAFFDAFSAVSMYL